MFRRDLLASGPEWRLSSQPLAQLARSTRSTRRFPRGSTRSTSSPPSRPIDGTEQRGFRGTHHVSGAPAEPSLQLSMIWARKDPKRRAVRAPPIGGEGWKSHRTLWRNDLGRRRLFVKSSAMVEERETLGRSLRGCTPQRSAQDLCDGLYM